MEPTLEQIKTDESVWPDWADYFKDNLFIKVPKGRPEAYVAVQGVGFKLYTSEPKEIGSIIAHGIPRPSKAFVPEVGVECEYWLKCDGEDAVFKCQPKYVSDKMVVAICFVEGRTIEQALEYHEAGFRPIKSEREKFVELLGSKQLLSDISVNDLAGALYDAGCRFVEPAK